MRPLAVPVEIAEAGQNEIGKGGAQDDEQKRAAAAKVVGSFKTSRTTTLQKVAGQRQGTRAWGDVRSQELSEDVAALRIQKLMRSKVGNFSVLDRKKLIERLTMEDKLFSSFLLFLLYSAIFGLLMQTLLVQHCEESLRGLHRSYESTFGLDEINEVTTVDQLRTYLRELSAASRRVQLQSSDYFVDSTEQKLVHGLVSPKWPLSLRSSEISARVDSPSFSISAWVNLGPSLSGYVIRKPMQYNGMFSNLSCWGIYVGDTTRLDFGAHDFGGIYAGQVSVVSGGTTIRNLHMLTVVVNQHKVFFYQNAELVSTRSLSRPVTDCAGETIQVGGEEMQVGEMVFFPRELTETEINEIFMTGMTLASLAKGKYPFLPAENVYDHLESFTQQHFDKTAISNEMSNRDREIGQVLQQGLILNLDVAAKQKGIPLPNVALEHNCSSDSWPPCRIVRGVTSTRQHDPNAQADFFDLMPARSFLGIEDGERMKVLGNARHQYDIHSFPHSIGPSFTISVWVNVLTDHSSAASTYLISKHLSSNHPARCWSMNIGQTRIGLYAGEVANGEVTQNALVYFPPDIDAKYYGLTDRSLLRHLVLVADAQASMVRGYMDGVLFGQTPHPNISALDCPSDPGAYIALMHRAPGSHDFVGDIQQPRLYSGVALTSEQVAAIHDNSVDPKSGQSLRECSYRDEGFDTNFKDLLGHDCSWFSEAVKTNPQVCIDHKVASSCPVACGIDQECFQGNLPRQSKLATFRAWERIMWVTPDQQPTSHVLCLADTVNVDSLISRCRNREAAPSQGIATGDNPLGVRQYVLDPLLNCSHCSELSDAIDPLCSFAVENDWTSWMEDELGAGGSFTLGMWVKALPSTYTDQQGLFRPVIQFFSSLSPPQPLMTIHFQGDILYVEIALHCGVFTESVGISVGGSFSLDDWEFLGVVFEREKDLEVQLSLMHNSKIFSEVHFAEWCPSASRRFLEGVSFSHDLLVSPILFRPEAVPYKQLLKEYYELKPAMKMREGPKQRDELRLHSKVQYEEKPFPGPGFLVAPPLLLQDRVGKTEVCSTQFGSMAIQSVWDDTVTGAQCTGLVQCSADLMGSPMALASCSTDSFEEEKFFGRDRYFVGGQRLFSEFLATITDSSVVVRGGKVLDTDRFIDGQTRNLQVVMAIIAPEEGVLSRVTLDADVGPRVSLRLTVEHVHTVEGSKLSAYRAHASGTVLCLILLGSISVTRVVQTWSRRRWRNSWIGDACMAGAAMVFLIIQWADNELSQSAVSTLVGSHSRMPGEQVDPLAGGRTPTLGHEEQGAGLLGVPWASQDVTYDVKLQRFFQGMKELSVTVSREHSKDLFGSFLLILLTVRLVLLISIHPRVSLLVATVKTGIDDFVHFFLLLSIIFLCSAMLAMHHFSSRMEDFETLGSTMSMQAWRQTLTGNWSRGGHSDMSWLFQFRLIMGELPESFGEDHLLSAYVLLFLSVVFFFMLSFLLAIIVDSFACVKAGIAEQEIEQSLLADLLACVLVAYKRAVHRWPNNTVLLSHLHSLSPSRTVGLELLFRRQAATRETSRAGASLRAPPGELSFTSSARLVPARPQPVSVPVQAPTAPCGQSVGGSQLEGGRGADSAAQQPHQNHHHAESEWHWASKPACVAFLEHYKRHDFLAPRCGEHIANLDTAVQVLEKRIARMFGAHVVATGSGTDERAESSVRVNDVMLARPLVGAAAPSRYQVQPRQRPAKRTHAWMSHPADGGSADFE